MHSDNRRNNMANNELELTKKISKETTEEKLKKTVDTNYKIGKVINCGKLRLRKRPSLLSDELAQIPVGEKVKINFKSKLARADDKDEKFYEVVFLGLEGFVLKDFVEVLENGTSK
jgi:hypothetical protein